MCSCVKLDLQSPLSCCVVGVTSQEQKNPNLCCTPCHQKRSLDPHHVVSGHSRNSISPGLILSAFLLHACLHLVRVWPPVLPASVCLCLSVTSWIARVPATYAWDRCGRQPWGWGKGREWVPWRALGRGYVDSLQEASPHLRSPWGRGKGKVSLAFALLCFALFLFLFVCLFYFIFR